METPNASNKITILGTVWDPDQIPNVAAMIANNRANAEAQIQSIADAWHNGSITSAIQALDSDLT